MYSREASRKAAVRAKLLTGVYVLQDTLRRFGKADNSSCVMCDTGEEENAYHFLLYCPALEAARMPSMTEIDRLLDEINIDQMTEKQKLGLF